MAENRGAYTKLSEKDVVGVLVWDGDGTAIKDNSWLRATELLGGDPNVHVKIFVEEYLNIISGLQASNLQVLYRQMKSKLIAHWKQARAEKGITRPITSGEIKAVFQTIATTVRDEVIAAIHKGFEYGFISIIVTGSSDELAHALVSRLRLYNHLDESFRDLELGHSNSQFHYDETGVFTDFDYDVNEPYLKAMQVDIFVRQLAEQIGVNPTDIIVIPIGDDESDTGLWFRYKGIYLDLKGKQRYNTRVDFTVNDVSELGRVLEKLIKIRLSEQRAKRMTKQADANGVNSNNK